MPCRSEHMEPTARERETTKVARLLMYALKAYSPKWTPSPILKEAAEGAYPDTTLCDVYTKNLCEFLEKLDENEQNKIIWNGRSKQARELADWWEQHQEWDKERKYQETIAKEDEYYVNTIVGFIKTQHQLAQKRKEPIDRKKIVSYLNDIRWEK